MPRLLFLLLFLIALVHGKRLPNIYWNSTNTIFDISNTDHVMGIDIDDHVSIFCPQPSEEHYEYSNIYMVTEDEYDHCVLLNNPHLLGSCNNNTKETSFSIVFRQFSPIPGGLEFVPGNTYYVISTSDGSPDGLGRKKGGLCKEKQMRMKFEIHSRKPHINPKFAARTLNKQESSSSSETTPVMYIIHNDEEEVEDDDDSSSSFLTSGLLIALLVNYLL